MKYHTIMTKFFKYIRDPKNKELRTGQAFYNLYHKEIFNCNECPELFYCSDDNEAYNIIADVIDKYLKSGNNSSINEKN